jgi:trk system potassium uptake protein TrkA
MYAVIIGAGRIGGSLARWLVAAGHEVAVIDWDTARCRALEDELGSISVVGDGTEESILGRAGANRADVFIATTDRDDQNLMACQVAKHRFGAARTISLVNIPDHDPLFGLLGIDQTINITELIVDRIEENLGGMMFEELDSAG